MLSEELHRQCLLGSTCPLQNPTAELWEVSQLLSWTKLWGLAITVIPEPSALV